MPSAARDDRLYARYLCSPARPGARATIGYLVYKTIGYPVYKFNVFSHLDIQPPVDNPFASQQTAREIGDDYIKIRTNSNSPPGGARNACFLDIGPVERAWLVQAC